ncbi:MAG: TonB-dependent receptor [Bacteroidetes bacterium]|nr:TonB-dependent receptor [Bacteroidota bacterium]
MIKELNTVFLATTGLLASLSMAAVQPNDSLRKDLKEVTVVATRFERNVLSTGRSVTILTASDLDKSVYSTVAELLSHQEGIYITGNNQSPGANESIFMRGSNSNQTSIFVDGIRINDGSTVNNTIDLSELPLSEIERIEILRGSNSILYGSSAIGGVIQITTFKPGKPGINGRVSLSSGLFQKSGSMLVPSANVGYLFKNGISVFGSAALQNVNGLDATIDTVTDPLVFKHRDKDDWNKRTARGGINYKWKNGEATLAGQFLKMKTDIDKSAFIDDDNYVLDYERKTLSGNLQFQPMQKLEVLLNTGLTNNTRNAQNDSSIVNDNGITDHSFAKDHYKSENLSVDAYLSWKEKYVRSSIGFSFQEEKMNQSNYYYSALFSPFIVELNTNMDNVNPKIQTSSLYAQFEIQGSLLHEKLNALNLILGARSLNHSKFGNEFIWEVNPSFQLSSTALIYFSFSKGLNAPSLYQLYAPDLYYTYDNNTSTGISRGNSKLKPEISDSYEFGLKQNLNENGFFGISVFKTITQNQIDYVYLWDKNVPVDQLGTDFTRDDYRGDIYLNTGKQTTYGIEFSFENKLTDYLKIHFNMSLVNGYLDYAQNNSTQEQTGGNHVQSYNNGSFLNSPVRTQGLTRRPNTARMELLFFPGKKISSTMGISYTGQRDDVFYDSGNGPMGALSTSPVKDYTLLDLSLQYKITSPLSAALKLENILNEKYSEINGFTTRGRGIYLKVNYVF